MQILYLNGTSSTAFDSSYIGSMPSDGCNSGGATLTSDAMALITTLVGTCWPEQQSIS